MSRQRRALIQRGDIWDADIPGVGIHPVVVVTRDTAITTEAGLRPRVAQRVLADAIDL